ncbi:MAG: redoxin domain-containing protein [Flavobacteriales bacterium]|nr:redoxin domain-containing protein [Flavobacteriales bacterium]
MKAKEIKKVAGILILIVIISLGGLLGNKVCQRNQMMRKIESIPEFNLYTLKDSLYTQQQIPQGLNTVFVYYNSECEYCNAEAEKIEENLSSFKNTQFIFVSFEKTDVIRNFALKYDLLNLTNVYFLRDKKLEFSNFFGAQSIPYLLVYSTDGKLVKRHNGVISIEELMNLL